VGLQTLVADIRHPVRRWGYIFVLPGMLYFAVFVAYPIVWDFALSLTATQGFSGIGKFVGLENYAQLLTRDPVFWLSFRNTFYYVLIVVPGIVLFAVFFGILFEQRVVGKGALRIAYFVPAITSVVAIGVVWRWLYDPTFGIFKHVLDILGLPPMAFLRDRHQVIPSIAVMGIWQMAGYNMIVVQAGLAGIPDEYYDAASLDGANGWQRTRRITLPLLMPIVTYLVVTSMITNLQVFDQIFIMTEGGPGDASSTLAYQLYQTAFTFQWFGIGSALAFILFAVILAITVVNVKILRDPY
jgi:multiple sugar transport system permease protein